MRYVAHVQSRWFIDDCADRWLSAVDQRDYLVMSATPMPDYAAIGSQTRPDFFIVGQPKSGSTALYHMLRQHPEIYMPDLKEPNFFATDLRLRFPPLMGDDRKPETMEEYLDLFGPAKPGQISGEASVLYLRSHVAAQGIAAHNPDARIIIMLREPSELLRSLHLELVQRHNEAVRDLRTALSLEDERRCGKAIPRRSHRPQLLLYSEHVRYVDQIRRFHAVFPPEQVSVLLYDEFRADNDVVMRKLFRLLGVDDTVSVTRSDANPTIQLRSAVGDDVVHRLSVGRGPVERAIKGAVKLVLSEEVRRALLGRAYGSLHGQPPPADPYLMAELRARFAPEVVSLSEYLGRDIASVWGYA